FDACAEFCRLDQAAFDPDFVSKPLEHFIPMVERVFARPKRSIYLREAS
ncbi:MAG: phosphohydrolase, partial [Pseudomonadota bacterium]